MLLKEGPGPLTDQQRRLLEEAEKSYSRLAGLATEVSDLAHLEAGTATFNRTAIDLRGVISHAIVDLPELRDRAVRVEFSSDQAEACVLGDAVRLKSAFASVVVALRRELVTSDCLGVRLEPYDDGGGPSFRITIGEAIRMDGLLAMPANELKTFDDCRGGNGLSLATARRIIEAHGGTIREPADGHEDGKAAAVLVLPRAERV
jgi:signal transduction histidine kinase